ncbi:hypothetical protein Acr_22g0003170 [Actinidia rufa]|uniref:Uncharacterized protein n=1 Tax=Actinidia rufa TaxID=165716 RepID=A0A7J0GJD8_9ERIC|nr:hypothetical protein Acr_22g0003170 [Actinidia rufa]
MELDHYRVIKTQCSINAAVLKGFIEQDRVYDFLVGLNPEFDQIRIQILGRQELSSLNEVVAMVRSEESRRSLMLDTPTIESSAMVAKHIKRDPANVEKRKDGLWCTYCNKAGHSREKCWKLHKKPPSREWNKKGESSRKSGHAHVAVAVAEHNEENKPEFTSLNQEEINRMRAFLTSLDKPTGATDHTTPLSKHFSTYSPCPSNKKIATADGTLVTVVGLGQGFEEDDWTC